jgi:uncharacterized protein (DUF2147 family)
MNKKLVAAFVGSFAFSSVGAIAATSQAVAETKDEKPKDEKKKDDKKKDDKKKEGEKACGGEKGCGGEKSCSGGK